MTFAFPDRERLDWNKCDGLLPAIAQHWRDGRVLMLGYMNRAALDASLNSGMVTFHSRSMRRLWTKGERSGHTLRLKGVRADCDADALLLQVEPRGPTCHLGSNSCFGDSAACDIAFLGLLDTVVAERHIDRPAGSYTTRLFDAGTQRIAQKVGEESIEVALAAVTEDDAALLAESADLLYHLVTLLRSRGLGLPDVAAVLRRRHDRVRRSLKRTDAPPTAPVGPLHTPER